MPRWEPQVFPPKRCVLSSSLRGVFICLGVAVETGLQALSYPRFYKQCFKLIHALPNRIDVRG